MSKKSELYRFLYADFIDVYNLYYICRKYTDNFDKIEHYIISNNKKIHKYFKFNSVKGKYC